MDSDVPKLTEARRVLREAQAAEMLSVHVQTLRKWRRNGEAPRHIWLSATRPGYVLADVIDWQEARRRAVVPA